MHTGAGAATGLALQSSLPSWRAATQPREIAQKVGRAYCRSQSHKLSAPFAPFQLLQGFPCDTRRETRERDQQAARDAQESTADVRAEEIKDAGATYRF